jgi:retron-type reverse transcriptase
LLILEPVFESRFSSASFAFRPDRNSRTAIPTIRRSFAGYLLYLKGDLSTLLDCPKINLVLNALIREVRDKKNSRFNQSSTSNSCYNSKPNGCFERKKKKRRRENSRRVLAEDEPKPDPYWLQTFDFAPEEARKQPYCGHWGVVSPLLANICLDELINKWMEERIREFYKPYNTDTWAQEQATRPGLSLCHQQMD